MAEMTANELLRKRAEELIAGSSGIMSLSPLLQAKVYELMLKFAREQSALARAEAIAECRSLLPEIEGMICGEKMADNIVKLEHAKGEHVGVRKCIDAISRISTAGDRVLAPSAEECLAWYEAQHTLHWHMQLLYVVDGYDLSCEHEDGVRVAYTVHGDTLLEAIRKAMIVAAKKD